MLTIAPTGEIIKLEWGLVADVSRNKDRVGNLEPFGCGEKIRITHPYKLTMDSCFICYYGIVGNSYRATSFLFWETSVKIGL